MFNSLEPLAQRAFGDHCLVYRIPNPPCSSRGIGDELTRLEAVGVVLKWFRTDCLRAGMCWYDVLTLEKEAVGRICSRSASGLWKCEDAGITSRPLEVLWTSCWQATAALLGAAPGVHDSGHRTPYIPGPRDVKLIS